MTDLFPKTPKAIRERIRRYERALKKELQTGYGGDGYGKRYLLGPLYMLLGDVDGALASFDWYEKSYPDDSGDPYQYLTWALALYKGGKKQEASNRLYCTMLENVYLLPVVLGQNPRPLDIWHGSNLAEMDYAMSIPEELLELWDDDARQWAQGVSEHPDVVERIARWVEIHRKLNAEPPGPERTALVEESFALRDQELRLC